jgi:hypothetical protein
VTARTPSGSLRSAPPPQAGEESSNYATLLSPGGMPCGTRRGM